MKRRATKVILYCGEAYTMSDNWTDLLEVRRDPYANFSVWGRKYGSDDKGKRRWLDWDKTVGLKSPLALYKAVEDEAEFLGITVEWVDAVEEIASIDWLAAAVIASIRGYEIPKLPSFKDLNEQRSMRSHGQVRIGAEWGYDMHEISIPFERWLRIVCGESWSLSQPYWYEGQRFTGVWSFDGFGELEVSYDDDGVGWAGELSGLHILEGPVIDGVDLAKLALHAAPE